VGEFEKEKTVPIKQEEAKTISDDKDSYLIKQLRRIP